MSTINLDRRIVDLMAAKPLCFQAAWGGYTTAHKGVITFDGGQSVFVKAVTDEMTAALSGFWAARAGLPQPEARQTVLMSQFRVALPWAARTLGLGKQPD